MKYIDADKLIDEIERRMKCYERDGCEPNDGKWVELVTMKHFIESLQQEQPHKSFCEENCKGYRDTGGKCFFGFNCSIKKAQEQPEVDLELEIKRFLSNATKMNKGEWRGKYPISDIGFRAVTRHFYELGLNARKEG